MGALSSATLRLRICRPCWVPQRPGGRAPPGDFILRTPDAHPLLGVVLEGEVEMISEDSFGKKSLLSVLPVGSIFGEELHLCQGQESDHRLPGQNPQPGCSCWTYGRILHACKLVCRFHHRMIENMVELIAEKNLTLVEKLEVVSRTTIREKLLTYLAGRRRLPGADLYHSHGTHRLGRVSLHRPLRHDPGAGPDEGRGTD